MKLKIIIPIILVVGILGTAILVSRSSEDRNIFSIGSENQKLPCPDISFPQDNRTLSEKLFNFVSNVFVSTAKSSEISPPSFRSELCLLEKPILNKSVMLLYKFQSNDPLPNAIAKIELPESFVLVSGNMEWRGDLSANEEKSFGIVVRSTKIGYFQLKASVFNDFSIYSDDLVYIEITPNNAILSSNPLNNWNPPPEALAEKISENNQSISSQLIISHNPELNKEFTVIYKVTPQIDLYGDLNNQMALSFPSGAFTVLKVEFPEGGRGQTDPYDDNRLTWMGAIAQGRTVEIKAILRVISTGQGTIFGTLDVFPPFGVGITKHIYDEKTADLYVYKDGGTFTMK